MKKQAELIAKALEKVKVKGRPVGFTICYDAREVIIMCGFDYPDSIAGKVFAAAEKAGLDDNQFSCCAEGTITGPVIYVNGGKHDRRWSRL